MFVSTLIPDSKKKHTNFPKKLTIFNARERSRKNMNIIFLISLLIHASSFTTQASDETTVIIKQGIRDFNDSFTIEVTSFTELLEKNKIFIDNTLFIKECRTTVGPLYIMGPAKSGKTINLHMLKTFLEIQVDEQGNRILPKNITSNYNLFVKGELCGNEGSIQKLNKQLAISQHKDLVEKDLGEYPVVYINFKDIKGNNVKEVRYSIGKSVQQAYQHHKYMINALENIIKRTDISTSEKNQAQYNLEIFQKILNNEIPDEINLLGEYLQNLCEILGQHFDQKTVLMFDDYDKPLTNILSLQDFPENDLAQVRETMDTFTIWAFRTNDQISEAYLTVEFELKQLSRGSWMNYVRTDVLVDYSEPISKYFVLNQNTVDHLFDLYKLPAEVRDRAYKWYRGFQSNQFNVYSIVNFLNSNEFANYFKDEDFELFVKSILYTHIGIRNIILGLLNELHIITSYDGSRHSIAEDEIYKLKPKIFNSRACYDQLTLSMFKLFLIRKGYLNVHLLYEEGELINYSTLRVEFSIPNNEIATSMCFWMISYYQSAYHIDDETLQNAATNLLSFANNDSSSIPLLEGFLGDLYNRSSPYLALSDDNCTESLEDPFHAIFTCVVLKMQYLSDFQIHVSHPKFTKRPTRAVTYGPFPNLKYVFINNHTSQAVILRLTYNQKVENTLKLLKQHESGLLEKLNYLKAVRVVAIKVRLDKTVQVYARSSTDQ